MPFNRPPITAEIIEGFLNNFIAHEKQILDQATTDREDDACRLRIIRAELLASRLRRGLATAPQLVDLGPKLVH
jgi:hypothetical protein